MITKALLREWSACWDDVQLTKAFGKRIGVTPRNIAADKAISAYDRVWVLAKCLGYLDERAARLFAIESAMTVCHLAGDDADQAVFAGLMNSLIEIEELPGAARDFLGGTVWGAARAAVWSATLDATWSAAHDATLDAVWGAARDAAWGATLDAAGGAARAAAGGSIWSAARVAALEESIIRAIEWLGPYADGWDE